MRLMRTTWIRCGGFMRRSRALASRAFRPEVGSGRPEVEELYDLLRRLRAAEHGVVFSGGRS